MMDNFCFLGIPRDEDPVGLTHVSEVEKETLSLFMSKGGRTGHWNARITTNLDSYLLCVSAEEPFQVTFTCVEDGLKLEENRWFYFSATNGQLQMDDY